MLDLHGGLFCLLVEMLKQHYELIAAKSCHCVTHPHCAIEPRSSQTQDFVTNMMPMQIVDVLESVEVRTSALRIRRYSRNHPTRAEGDRGEGFDWVGRSVHQKRQGAGYAPRPPSARRCRQSMRRN